MRGRLLNQDDHDVLYSNQPEVELFANGVSMGVQKAEDHFFRFTVPNNGTTELVAVAGDLRDSGTICHVDQFDESYRLKEQGTILNWFDITEKEGFFSLNDTIKDISATEGGRAVMGELMAMVGMGAGSSGMGGGADLSQMLGGFTILRLTNLMGNMTENKITKEMLLALNERLNNVPRP